MTACASSAGCLRLRSRILRRGFDSVNQFHGADAKEDLSLSIRVDGIFTDEFRAKIPFPRITALRPLSVGLRAERWRLTRETRSERLIDHALLDHTLVVEQKIARRPHGENTKRALRLPQRNRGRISGCR
jgi:hypothetical protein